MSLAPNINSNTSVVDVLTLVSDKLTTLGYIAIKHVRLSYDTNRFSDVVQSEDNQWAQGYQGLTRAYHDKNKVMVKWEMLVQDNDIKSSLSEELTLYQKIASDLAQQTDNIAVPSYKERQSNQAIIVPITNYLNKKKITFKDNCWLFSLIEMPYFELGIVASYINKNSLSNTQKLGLIHQMAQCIERLHQAGWVHGDIKPSNFLVTSLDTDTTHDVGDTLKNLSIVISDFSNSTLIGCSSNKTDRHQMELTHLVSGTPAYLAPECWRGERHSIQSDVYAFGISVFEILIGHRPFRTEDSRNIDDWALQHCQTPIPLLPNDWRNFQTLMDKLLAKSVNNRFYGMTEVCKALEHYMVGLEFKK